MAAALSQAVDLDAVARVTVTHARAAARAASAVVMVVADGGRLVPMAAEGPDGVVVEPGPDLPADVEHPLP